MSLRTFHIVFVGTCVVLALYVAYWTLTTLDGPVRFVWTGLALAGAVVLLVYGRAFMNKILPANDSDS